MTSPAAPRDDGRHTAPGRARPAAGGPPAVSRRPRERPPAGEHGTGGGQDPAPDAPGMHAAGIDAYIRDLVASAPPLTPAQRDRLALLFTGPARRAGQQGGPAARGRP
jgi:hypothetical protein